MKTQLFTFVKSLILKEEGKISVSKFMTWTAGVCATIVASQNLFVSNGIDLPVKAVLMFKWAGIISGIIALIRTRNSKQS